MSTPDSQRRPGKGWTSSGFVKESTHDDADDSLTATNSILVQDLNPSIPSDDLEQGLQGLFSVFGRVHCVVTIPDGEQ